MQKAEPGRESARRAKEATVPAEHFRRKRRPSRPIRLAAAVAAFRAKYPPTTPMIVGGIEEVRLDEPAHELYTADNYLGGRVMVFDLDTFAFKRGWGAYGHKLSEITTDDKDRDYVPNGPEPKEFRNHLTLNISKDGLVYAADRGANRIDVTTKEGKFVKEFILAPSTGVPAAGHAHKRARKVPPEAWASRSIRSSGSYIFPIYRTTPSGSSTAKMAKLWAGSAAWAKTAASSSACT